MRLLSRHQRRMLFSSSVNTAAESCSPLQVYTLMHRSSARIDSFSILSALKSTTSLPFTRHLHAHLLKLGFSAHLHVATCLLSIYAPTLFPDARLLFDEMPHRSPVTWNIMITANSRRGQIRDARHMFEEMPQRNQSSWSSMIAAYIHNSLLRDGLSLFRLMITTTAVTPDELTLGPILSACGRLGSVGLPLGKSTHAFTIKNKWDLSAELGASLVDMYAKCGALTSAATVFAAMRDHDRNVVAWTSLICGAAQHGHGQEALAVFERMRESGVEPNDVTFTGVLSACVQTGMVDEGRRCFGMIERPRIQHYGCMVDLYGKKGLLREAYEVIETMPYETNAVVWGSFLSSCMLHEEMGMVDRVVDKVMGVIRPDKDGGVYSLLSQLYLLSGRVSEAEGIREMMVAHNVRKIRASSFIN
ncbi:pentatricopeptide repeat-containing protein-like protein [Salvia divinorum]|uniref:Pentatricopeptide repeat-containing protein-like protein n=1 Tax=Salvia divinorum TaxID=28513 RepID=A0ABD1G3G0_SALDI